jgi:hypothetical protein
MQRSLLLLLVVVGLFAAGLFAWWPAPAGVQDAEDRLVERTSTIAAADAARDASHHEAADARGTWRGPESVVPPGGGDEVSDGPGGLEVYVLRLEDDSPIEGARVWTETRSAPNSPPERSTDATGVARWTDAELRAHRKDAFGVIDSDGDPQRHWPLGASAPGRITYQEDVEWAAAGAPARHFLRLEAQREIEVHLANERGDELKPADVGLDPQAAQSVSLVLTKTCGQPGGKLDMRGAPPQRLKPISWEGLRFAWRVDLRGVEPTCVNVVVGDFVLASRPVDAHSTQLAVQVAPAVFQAASTSFGVRVLTTEGERALANVGVRVRTAGGFDIERATDAEGRVRFGGILGSEFTIGAAAPGLVRAETRLRPPLPEEIVLNLAPGRSVRGTVVDESGQPCPLTRVGLYLAKQLGTVAEPLYTAEVGYDGAFAFADVPTDELVLFGLGQTDGKGFLPPRETLPPTARLVKPGSDESGLTVQAFVPKAH